MIFHKSSLALGSIFLFSLAFPGFAVAQDMYQRQQNFADQLQQIEINRSNTVNLLTEASSLKSEARTYYSKGNKKKACITIQQANDLEISAGYSSAETRKTIRQYCG
jgi:hypothetical protein